MINSIIKIFFFSGLVLISIRQLCFYYLEISNKYNSFPFFEKNIYKMFFEIGSYYTKKVKPSDIFIVKLSNFILKLGWVLILITVLMISLKLIFKF
jgi:hypothetical protein